MQECIPVGLSGVESQAKDSAFSIPFHYSTTFTTSNFPFPFFVFFPSGAEQTKGEIRLEIGLQITWKDLDV